MPDRYLSFINSSTGRFLAKRFGLPQPVVLDRDSDQSSVIPGNAIVGSATGSLMMESIEEILQHYSVPHCRPKDFDPSRKLKAVIYDATGVGVSPELDQLHGFFHPIIKSFAKCVRVVVVGLAPEHCSAEQRVAQRALLGFIKSLAKELRAGGTANLIWTTPQSGPVLAAPLAFLASNRSAYVSGQYLKVVPAAFEEGKYSQMLEGRNILVTGAARGIGRAIVQMIQRRGGRPTCLDIPAMESELKATSDQVGGDWLTLDVTSENAGQRIAQHFLQRPLHGIVHNAGITRDKKLVNMQLDAWNRVLRTNLYCQQVINEYLVSQGTLQDEGRIVLISSISGIGGIAGQTNYSTSKAGVIGMVEAYATQYQRSGITINAVAPGFIETDMIQTIPFAKRQAGQRLNSLSQAGLPQDVAEAVTLFLQRSAGGLTGNVLRVCGQALLGA